MEEKKIMWQRNGKDLRAYTNVAPRGYSFFLREEDMVEVQQWCQLHECGKRMSFDTFRFKTRAQVTAFLLRWG